MQEGTTNNDWRLQKKQEVEKKEKEVEELKKEMLNTQDPEKAIVLDDTKEKKQEEIQEILNS